MRCFNHKEFFLLCVHDSHDMIAMFPQLVKFLPIFESSSCQHHVLFLLLVDKFLYTILNSLNAIRVSGVRSGRDDQKR